MRTLFVIIAFVGLAGPVGACLNDRETPQHEREFRSQYGEPAVPREPIPLAHSPSPKLFGAGAVLLTGAFFVAVNLRRVKA